HENRGLKLEALRAFNCASSPHNRSGRAIKDLNDNCRVAQYLSVSLHNVRRDFGFSAAKSKNRLVITLESIEKPIGPKSTSPIELKSADKIDIDEIPKMNKVCFRAVIFRSR